jgi:hypothetical protein
MSDGSQLRQKVLKVPDGDTNNRGSDTDVGQLRFNTDLDCLENYTSQGWLKVSIAIPIINTVSGTVINGVGGTITLSGTQFGSGSGTVRFRVGSTNYDVSATPSGSTVSADAPSGVYNSAAGTQYYVKYINEDGGQSGEVTVGTIVAPPSGGSVSTVSGDRVHIFTGSSQFVNTLNLSNVQVLIVGGGGGGGASLAGGGGGGGVGIANALSVNSGTYQITVGSAGSGTSSTGSNGGNGGTSSAFGQSILGGSGGNSRYAGGPRTGGANGGGAATDNTSRPAGTKPSAISGFTTYGGYTGGAAYGGSYYPGGGGAGAGGNGGSPPNNSSKAGNGGPGVTSSITGTNYYWGGGGGGSTYESGPAGDGGAGGGGGGSCAAGYRGSGGSGYNPGQNGQGGGNNESNFDGGKGGANTGGGAGAASHEGDNNAGTGGTGIVVVRYSI